MNIFLEHGRDITEENSYELFSSVLSRCDVEGFKLLLQDKRLKPNLSSVLSFPDIECFKLLLKDERIDPAEHNSNVLNQAVGLFDRVDFWNETYHNEKTLEIVKILLEDGRAKEEDILDQVKWKKIKILLNRT